MAINLVRVTLSPPILIGEGSGTSFAGQRCFGDDRLDSSSRGGTQNDTCASWGPEGQSILLFAIKRGVNGDVEAQFACTTNGNGDPK